MIIIKDQQYSGTVSVTGDNELTVVLSTYYQFEDVLAFTKDATEIKEIDFGGREKVYNVTRPISASRVALNTYAIRYSTQKSEVEILEEKNQELSNAIDDILVMMLEG